MLLGLVDVLQPILSLPLSTTYKVNEHSSDLLLTHPHRCRGSEWRLGFQKRGSWPRDIPRAPPLCSDVEAHQQLAWWLTERKARPSACTSSEHLEILRDADFASHAALQHNVEKKHHVFVNVGANKGYLAATLLALWSPWLGINPTSCHKSLMQLIPNENPESSNVCGVCQDCHDLILLPRNMTHDDILRLSSFVSASVFAVEPQQSNYALLQSLASQWSDLSSVSPIIPCFVALADFEDTIQIEERGPGDEGASIGNENVGNKPKTTVHVTKLDYLVQSDLDPSLSFVIDFISIDAEGYDPAILDGALETLPFTRALAFEYGTWIMSGNERLRRRSRSLGEVVDKLDSHGFSCYLEWPSALIRLSGCWMPEYETHSWSNVLCVSRRDKLWDRALAAHSTHWQMAA